MDAALQLTQRTDALSALTAGLGAVVYMLLQGRMQLTERFNGLEAIMRRPISIGLIALMATILMGAGAVNLPLRIRALLTKPAARFVVIALVGFVAAGDIETAIVGSLFVLALLQLARSPSERKDTPYMV